MTNPNETCWRSECRNGCYYPDVCSLHPIHDAPEFAREVAGVVEVYLDEHAAAAVYDETCGTCTAVRRRALTIADALLPLLRDIVQDELTGALHPEFGTEWREPDGIIYKAVQEARGEA